MLNYMSMIYMTHVYISNTARNEATLTDHRLMVIISNTYCMSFSED